MRHEDRERQTDMCARSARTQEDSTGGDARLALEATSTPLIEFDVPEATYTSVRALAPSGLSPDEIPADVRGELRKIRCVWLNRAAQSYLGVADAEATAAMFAEWTSSRRVDDSVGITQALSAAILDEPADGDFTLVNLRGEQRDVRICWRAFTAVDGSRRLMATLLDITGEAQIARELSRHQEHLKIALTEQAEQMRASQRTLSATSGLVQELVATRDPYTAEHMRDVAELAIDLASRLKCDDATIEMVRRAALLHDVGKVSIPAELLNKSAPLTDSEFLLIKDHVNAGCELLTAAGFDETLIQIVGQHHERWDGSGYPAGTRGEAITYGARILAVADVVASMRMHRPYRAALPHETVVDELATGSGVRYDPEIARVAVDALTEAVPS